MPEKSAAPRSHLQATAAALETLRVRQLDWAVHNENKSDIP